MTYDPKQFDRLIYQQVLRAVGNQLSRDDVQDIVASIHLDLVERKLAMHDPAQAKLSTYIGMVAYRSGVDAMRQYGRHAGHEVGMDPIDLGQAEDTTADALTRLIRCEQLARVKAAVKKLKPRDQEMVECILADSFDLDRLAKRYDMTTSGVLTWRIRTIKKLQGMLGKKGDS